MMLTTEKFTWMEYLEIDEETGETRLKEGTPKKICKEYKKYMKKVKKARKKSRPKIK